MNSEWIKHDGSARCPVEGGALVHVRSGHGGTVGNPRLAHRIEWGPLVKEYTVISGWSRPLADIFAELPDEAEWVYTDINGAFVWAQSEPKLGERCFVNPDGWACARPPAIHHGYWRESKRKRPKRDRAFDLAREATAGQLDSLKEIIKRGGVEAVLNDYGHKVQQSELEKDLQERFAEKPAPWFVCYGDTVERLEGDGYGKLSAEDRAIGIAQDNQGLTVTIYEGRAVASFTAKVERTTYENGALP